MDYAMAGFAIAASLIKPVAKHEEDIESLKKRIKELELEVERLTMN
jgi:archaellum component FlaC